MKPQLPIEIATHFPTVVIMHIQSFVPHFPPKPKKSPSICSYSPEMERDLHRIQNNCLKGKCEYYMKELEDFVLD